MDGEARYENPVERVQRLMKATFGDTFKAYYYDDPIDIPAVNLPCMIVEKMAGRVSLDATATDKVQTELNIRILLDKSDDFGASETVDQGKRKLERYIEERDKTTGQYLPDTVLGALRANLTLDSTTIRNDMDWQYYIQPRANMVVTTEGLVSIIVEQRIFVPNRT